MNTTMTTGSVTQLWQGLVNEAEARSHTRLDEELESYLVFTLVRHSRDDLLVGRTLSLEFLDGLGRSGGVRHDCLRDVGDRCLLIAGLFAGQAWRRRVSREYYLDIGRAAYRELGDCERAGLAGLYRELASAFAALVRVLAELRAPTGIGPDTHDVLTRRLAPSPSAATGSARIIATSPTGGQRLH